VAPSSFIIVCLGNVNGTSPADSWGRIGAGETSDNRLAKYEISYGEKLVWPRKSARKEK